MRLMKHMKARAPAMSIEIVLDPHVGNAGGPDDDPCTYLLCIQRSRAMISTPSTSSSTSETTPWPPFVFRTI
jgi:hypothetical protein